MKSYLNYVFLVLIVLVILFIDTCSTTSHLHIDTPKSYLVQGETTTISFQVFDINIRRVNIVLLDTNFSEVGTILEGKKLHHQEIYFQDWNVNNILKDNNNNNNNDGDFHYSLRIEDTDNPLKSATSEFFQIIDAITHAEFNTEETCPDYSFYEVPEYLVKGENYLIQLCSPERPFTVGLCYASTCVEVIHHGSNETIEWEVDDYGNGRRNDYYFKTYNLSSPFDSNTFEIDLEEKSLELDSLPDVTFNTSLNITWNATGYVGDISIELFTPEEDLIATLQDNYTGSLESYLWSANSFSNPFDSFYKIGITSNQYSNISSMSSPFRILAPPPSVHIDTPSSPYLITGETYNISFSVTGTTDDTITLYLCRDDKCDAIAGGLSKYDTSYAWQVSGFSQKRNPDFYFEIKIENTVARSGVFEIDLTEKTIEVETPTEYWWNGEEVTIQWIFTGYIGDVGIYLQRGSEPGFSQPVNELNGLLSETDWTVNISLPINDIYSKDYYLVIQSLNYSEVMGQSDLFEIDFEQKSLNIEFPTLEYFIIGDMVNISWQYSGTINSVSISILNGDKENHIISTSDNDFEWTVAIIESIGRSDNYQIRLSSDSSAITSTTDPFEIDIEEKSLELIQPNQTAIFHVGQELIYEWSYSGYVGSSFDTYLRIIDDSNQGTEPKKIQSDVPVDQKSTQWRISLSETDFDSTDELELYIESNQYSFLHDVSSVFNIVDECPDGTIGPYDSRCLPLTWEIETPDDQYGGGKMVVDNFTLSFSIDYPYDIQIDWRIGYFEQPSPFNDLSRPIPVSIADNKNQFNLPYIQGISKMELFLEFYNRNPSGLETSFLGMVDNITINVQEPCPQKSPECIDQIRKLLNTTDNDNEEEEDEVFAQSNLSKIKFEDSVQDDKSRKKVRQEVAQEVSNRFQSSGTSIDTREARILFLLLNEICNQELIDQDKQLKLTASDGLSSVSDKTTRTFIEQYIDHNLNTRTKEEVEDAFNLALNSASRFTKNDEENEDISNNILTSISNMSFLRSSTEKSGQIVSTKNGNVEFSGIKLDQNQRMLNETLSSLKLERASNSSSTSIGYVEFPRELNLHDPSQYQQVHVHFTRIDTNPFAFINFSTDQESLEDDNPSEERYIFDSEFFFEEMEILIDSEQSSSATNVTQKSFGKVVSGLTQVELKDEKQSAVPINRLSSPVKIGISFDGSKYDEEFERVEELWYLNSNGTNTTEISTSFQCRFLDPETKKWSAQGCTTEYPESTEHNNDHSPSQVICSCSHLTDFAVVRIISSYEYNIPSQPITPAQLANNWVVLVFTVVLLVIGISVFVGMIIWDIRENLRLRVMNESQFDRIVSEILKSQRRNSESFGHRMKLLLRKDHRLIGFLLRRRYDAYTRSQRITVILTAILVNMAVNSAVYSIDQSNVWDLREAIKFILLGAITTIFVTPVPVSLGILWRCVRPPSIYQERMAQIENSEREQAQEYSRRVPWIFVSVMILLMSLCTVFCVITVWQFYGTWWEALLLSVAVMIGGSIFTVFKIRSVNLTRSMEKNYQLLPFTISSISMWIVCLVLCLGSAVFIIYVGVANNLARDRQGQWVLSNVTSILLNLTQLSTIVLSGSLATTSLRRRSLRQEKSSSTGSYNSSEAEHEMQEF